MQFVERKPFLRSRVSRDVIDCDNHMSEIVKITENTKAKNVSYETVNLQTCEV